MDSIKNLMNSEAAILVVVAVVILFIIIGAASKSGSGGGKGCGWLITLIILGVIGYLLISNEIIVFPR